MTVFVDSSVLFGAAVSSDSGHKQARALLEHAEGAVTSDHVLVETWGLIHRKIGRHAAMRFWTGIRYAPLHIEFVGPADLERAQAIAERWHDQTFSIVDCTSFALMERIGCRRAATFDSDFAIYRYGPDATRAFEILR